MVKTTVYLPDDKDKLSDVWYNSQYTIGCRFGSVNDFDTRIWIRKRNKRRQRRWDKMLTSTSYIEDTNGYFVYIDWEVGSILHGQSMEIMASSTIDESEEYYATILVLDNDPSSGDLLNPFAEKMSLPKVPIADSDQKGGA